MGSKIVIPVCFWGQLREFKHFNAHYQEFLESEKYTYKFYIATWESPYLEKLTLPFESEYAANEQEHIHKLREVTYARLKDEDSNVDLTAARIAFHLHNIKDLFAEDQSKYEFYLFTRPDHLLNRLAFEYQLDCMIESKVNTFNKPVISLKEGIVVQHGLSAPYDVFFIANTSGTKLMLEMYENVFIKDELKDIKIPKITGPHKTWGTYITNNDFIVLSFPISSKNGHWYKKTDRPRLL